jgi:hypothetical protein
LKKSLVQRETEMSSHATEFGPVPKLRFDVQVGHYLSSALRSSDLAVLRDFFERMRNETISVDGIVVAENRWLFNVGNHIVELRLLARCRPGCGWN